MKSALSVINNCTTFVLFDIQFFFNNQSGIFLVFFDQKNLFVVLIRTFGSSIDRKIGTKLYNNKTNNDQFMLFLYFLLCLAIKKKCLLASFLSVFLIVLTIVWMN